MMKLITACFALAISTHAPANSKPNILFIIADEFRVVAGFAADGELGLCNEGAVGTAVRPAADPVGRWQKIQLNGERFLRELPDSEPEPISLDAAVAFTTSPRNEMIRETEYHFDTTTALAGFDPSGSDKLVVTLSHERGQIRSVRYGGVEMVEAISASNDIQHTAIYYLDSPGRAADLAVSLDGTANGVGGSLFALSSVRPGGPAEVGSERKRSLRLQGKEAGSFAIASHAQNNHQQNSSVTARVEAPFQAVFDGATGSSAGGSGHDVVERAGSLDIRFRGSDARPVTAAAIFAPLR